MAIISMCYRCLSDKRRFSVNSHKVSLEPTEPLHPRLDIDQRIPRSEQRYTTFFQVKTFVHSLSEPPYLAPYQRAHSSSCPASCTRLFSLPARSLIRRILQTLSVATHCLSAAASSRSLEQLSVESLFVKPLLCRAPAPSVTRKFFRRSPRDPFFVHGVYGVRTHLVPV
jgi:hypothetical protein